jgi:hypothetical protein
LDKPEVKAIGGGRGGGCFFLRGIFCPGQDFLGLIASQQVAFMHYDFARAHPGFVGDLNHDDRSWSFSIDEIVEVGYDLNLDDVTNVMEAFQIFDRISVLHEAGYSNV